MAAVAVRAVTKTYPGPVEAVRGLDLEVGDGELVAIVGPSGCGKTTTLRLIAGLERPDSGTVLIGGRDVTRRPPCERNVAMVFQDHALYPHLTVRGNLAFRLRLRKVPRDEIDRRVAAAAGMLGLKGLLERRPGELSGGERQRAALGRAIVAEPDCLLLDEPLGSLDPELRRRLRAELAALQKRLRLTTLHVTHDHEEAAALGDRVAVMAEGRITAVRGSGGTEGGAAQRGSRRC